MRFEDKTTCQPLPLNKPTIMQAQIGEGGNPFGNIPQEIELCFENSTMLLPREDQVTLKSGEKSERQDRGKAPRRAVKMGSNFSNRKDIISMKRLKLQLLEILLPETPQTECEGPQFCKVVPEPSPEPGDTEESREHAKFKSVEEAGRRMYMAIAGHRTPQHRHVENHHGESYWMTRDTDPEKLLSQEQLDLQEAMDASKLSFLDREFQAAADPDTT